ncbi:casein kinase 1 [Nematocida displodere]|uniref:Casein kinase 1 n=1 Tax=Nematocida displodere TaxID=1805483 RepID=A0A177ECC3_9MICR|nr:casein kinase 1 [Nematocida displodere]
MKEGQDLRLGWMPENRVEKSTVSSAKVKSRGEVSLLQPGDTIGDYVLTEKIGQGSFGMVFEGHASKSIKKVAIKVEINPDSRYSQLENEYATYMELKGVPGFPRVEYFGECGGHTYLVMEHLGMSLEDMLALRNRRFCTKTIFIVVKRMIDLIEKIHSIGKVHRDLKPDNFLVGRDPKKLFLIDLGMAKEFVRQGQHVPSSSGRRLTGTPRYASVNAHKGLELSRRDDLESIGYIMIYLAKGKLPWQGIKETPREKCRLIGEQKRSIRVEKLVKDLPGSEQMEEYFQYVRALSFDTTPNYQYLKDLFDRALASNSLSDDGVFEWEYVFKGATEDMVNDSLDGDHAKKKGLLARIKRFLGRCFTQCK